MYALCVAVWPRAGVAHVRQTLCWQPAQGAVTVLHAATERKLRGGRYWHDCREARPSAQARDARLAAALWEASAAAVGLSAAEAAWP